ncbi:MAG: hypothetical protein ACJ72B_02655, partial [Ornithinibacter sp.]
MTTSLRDPALNAWGDPAHYDRNDPFPLFARVRATGPVHEVRLADGHPAWLIVGYDQARAALNDPRLSKDMHAALAHSGEVVAEGLPGPALARHMLAVDPPDHTRLRRWPPRHSPDGGWTGWRNGSARSCTACSPTWRRARGS